MHALHLGGVFSSPAAIASCRLLWHLEAEFSLRLGAVDSGGRITHADTCSRRHRPLLERLGLRVGLVALASATLGWQALLLHMLERI